MPDGSPPVTHVLVFCPEVAQQRMFNALFGISGLVASIAADEQAFYHQLENSSVDVVLLVEQAESQPGAALCVKLRAPASLHRELPVVFIFPENTPPELALQSLHLGAYDYLIQPFNEIALLTKVTVLAKVKYAEDEFRKLAIRDKLTGLYDRRYLFMRFNEEFSRAKRYSKPITCLAMDVDGMRATNDKYGEEAGDLLLQSIADLLVSAKREIDVLARPARDEFMMVLYNTDTISAMVLASRVIVKLAELSCAFDEQYHPTMCIGVAGIEAAPELSMHAQELQEQAELALKQAKIRGPGTTVVYDDDMAEAALRLP